MKRLENIRWGLLATVLAWAAVLTAGAILVNPTGAEQPLSGQALAGIGTGRLNSEEAPATHPGPGDRRPLASQQAASLASFLPHIPQGFQAPFGFGRGATPEEIAAWDIDVRPDGTGLPPGGGTAAQGAGIYAEKCSACHGPTGTEGPFDVLVKPFDPAAPWPQFPRTIGNYWPYATTVYDYVNRAMPFTSPNSLEDGEVYSLVAFLLSRNGLIPGDAVMNSQTLPAVEMRALRFFRQASTP